MLSNIRSWKGGAVAAIVGIALLAVPTVPALAGAGPTVSSFNPSSGSPGAIVSVTGNGFMGGSGVSSVAFGAVPTTFNVSDDQHLSATVPFGATTGKISVTTSEGTGVSANDFVVQASGPSISGFTPTSGTPGTQVAISGSNFTGVSAVRFNGTSATFNFISSAQVNATVPAGATTGKISLTTPSGTATSSSNFSVSSGNAPTISGFSPSSGAVGTSVTINGNRFTGATSVTFNGVGASFAFQNDNRVTAMVPAGATTGKIALTTPFGTATSSSNFSVSSGNAPTISGFSPSSGAVGTSVTINGNRFTGVSAVRFKGVNASFAFQSDNRVVATVPAGATNGRISLTTPSGTATSSSNFIVTSTGPIINGFSPSSGPVGTSVTINGNRFTGVTAIRFNGMAASYTFQSDNRVTAFVPSGATTGRITVTTPSGTATSPSDFMVTGGGGGHERTVSLSITRRHASGHVSVDDGYAACATNVPVVIKRHRHGDWVWVTTTSTDGDGDFRAFIGRSRGEYRARAKRITLVNGVVCEGDQSRITRRGPHG